MADVIEETAEAKLKRHEDALVACMAEIERLRAENARLRSEAGAHDVLRNIYLDEAQSSGVRVKAAQAALNVEKPRLESVPPPLELTAEPIEPLADVVRRQRVRADKMLLEDPQYQGLPKSRQVILLKPNDGNGNSGSND